MTKTPYLTDMYVGSRVCARRLAMNLTQEDLGNRAGVTFQQIQKYEKGTNRISASRLQEIANALQVSPAFFFEGGPLQTTGNKGIEALDFIAQLSGSPDLPALIKSFTRINDKKLRRSIVALLEQVVKSKEGDEVIE